VLGGLYRRLVRSERGTGRGTAISGMGLVRTDMGDEVLVESSLKRLRFGNLGGSGAVSTLSWDVT